LLIRIPENRLWYFFYHGIPVTMVLFSGGLKISLPFRTLVSDARSQMRCIFHEVFR